MIPYCENPSEPLRIQKTIGLRIAPHLHIASEIIFVEKGEIKLTLGSLDYTLTERDFAFIMPSTLHSITPSSDDTSVFTIDCKDEVIPDILRRYSGLRPASPVLRSTSAPDTLFYALAALTAERDKYIAFSWANVICSIITAKLRFAEIHDGVTSNLSNRILAYLGAHFREQISLDTLAEEMGVSRFHLSHLFSNKLGIGFKEYLNNLRVEHAKGLLRSTDVPISEIYSAAGFENQRTFNRVFRDTTGASPRDYRLHREDYGTVAPKNDTFEVEQKETAVPELSSPVVIMENDIEIEHTELPEQTALSDKAKKRTEKKETAKRPSPVPSKEKAKRIKKEAEENTDIRSEEASSQDNSAAVNSKTNVKKKKKDQAWFL